MDQGTALRPAERILLTLAIAWVGGALFWTFGLPLPWLLGATAAVMVGALRRVPVSLPFTLRSAVLSILGVLLGATFSWEVVLAARGWLASLAILFGTQLAMGAVIVLVLYRWLRYPAVTAYLAGTPGIMSQAIALADDRGADLKRVSLFHATRLVCLVAAVPVLVGLWLGGSTDGSGGVASTGPAATRDAGLIDWTDSAVLLASAAVGIGFGRLLRLPSPFLMGPLIASAVVHIAGLTEAAPPPALVALAQLVLGAYLGARFAGSSLGELRAIARISVPVSLFILAWTCTVAALMARLSSQDFAACLLILTPGALSQMSLVALALDIEPAMVATHHAVRVCTYLFLVPVGLDLWQRATDSDFLRCACPPDES